MRWLKLFDGKHWQTMFLLQFKIINNTVIKERENFFLCLIKKKKKKRERNNKNICCKHNIKIGTNINLGSQDFVDPLNISTASTIKQLGCGASNKHRPPHNWAAKILWIHLTFPQLPQSSSQNVSPQLGSQDFVDPHTPPQHLKSSS